MGALSNVAALKKVVLPALVFPSRPILIKSFPAQLGFAEYY